MHRLVLIALVLLLVTGIAVYLLLGSRHSQTADASFDTSVAHPAYTGEHPVVCLDEGHHNIHTASGTYKPFARLMAHDGYEVRPVSAAFSSAMLAPCGVLVVANATGANESNDAPAFTSQEVAAARQWVQEGGSLLLITDHFPMGPAAQALSHAFGVEMSTGMTFDDKNYDTRTDDNSRLVYSRANGLLGAHAITSGRSAGEQVGSVITFTGQSLSVPANATALLKLSSAAIDTDPEVKVEKDGSDTRVVINYVNPHSAAGRAQAVAMEFGKGRAVITGEAAMLTAQLDGRTGKPFGMNVAGCDNRQFALNTMHWLSRLL
jgi:hypothetical protein